MIGFGIRAWTLTAASLLAVTLAGACAETTAYTPVRVARGEVTLRYEGGFQVWAGGARVARGLSWKGLTPYVECVPEAREHAEAAVRAGRRAIAFSIVGGILGGISVGGLAGLADEPRRWTWLGTGLGAAALGLVFAGAGRHERNAANGHAVDAINFYNDRVGSLGATCHDLTYPAPAGPAPTASPGPPVAPPPAPP